MASLGRRHFLKLLGLVGSASLTGCSSESPRRLIPYLNPPKDVVPGKASWYATTCMECQAGCGLWARNRDGRVVKLEGNPAHPVNRGALCARGQAGLQGLYDPDRFRGPGEKDGSGVFRALNWEEAFSKAAMELKGLLSRGEGERAVFMTGLLTGSLRDLCIEWVEKLALGGLVMYEPLSYEPLAQAAQKVFGTWAVPHYSMEKADLIISFGADFLSTWISPVEYARRFSEFRTPEEGKRGFFVFFGPRLSQTAANADMWLQVRPGAQRYAALALLKASWKDKEGEKAPWPGSADLEAFLEKWEEETLLSKAGLKREEFHFVRKLFQRSRRPIVLSSGLETVDPHAHETAWISHVLCSLKKESLELIDVGRGWSIASAAKRSKLLSLRDKIESKEISLLLVHGANPVFSFPEFEVLEEAVRKGHLKLIGLSSTEDETTSLSSLILPASNFLEDWADVEPRPGIRGIVQPVMGTVFDTKGLGDVLLELTRRLIPGDPLGRYSFDGFLKERWKSFHEELGIPGGFDSWWAEILRRGGQWVEPSSSKRCEVASLSPPMEWASDEGGQGFELLAYPTVQFLDGRGANRPWLQELPDPMTQITWGSWLEIHPQDAERLGISNEQVVVLKGFWGEAEIPAYVTPLTIPGVLSMPLGQGHTSFGRFAKGCGVNGWKLCSRGANHVSIQPRALKVKFANTDGSLSQHGRGLAQGMDLGEYQEAKSKGQLPKLRLPLPEAYDPKEDFYPPHKHNLYRWAMVVDLDRCIGCGACVIACNAENNVAIVGRELVLQGREMQWIRIERYLEDHPLKVRFLPMLCQHCDAAPCESVCPVYAPHHSAEGLNNQVYNRCIGTRFCSQNCPYKVRRFNWFTFTRPKPLHLQLNPDVTVRQKGVMEKCSFCVQRIVEAKNRIRGERRTLRDGEVIPACAQTCPTEALVFGNLMDPESRVARLSRDPRAYQVLGHLNTKPAVIYLKRLETRREDMAP